MPFGIDPLAAVPAVVIAIRNLPLYRLPSDRRKETKTLSETLALASVSGRHIVALFIQRFGTFGLRARAVSGHLYEPQVQTDDAGSTHAWAKVYLRGAGWIAFDPTHRSVGDVNLRQVAVA
ncbi:transglutaminase-like domain-containing protein, partial [Pararhizobium haloflavum]|uniref:transglutaminase-like domain-containing protein n=1 Tax=Pararhizobium haloflavum TaxID=2037914 RepID=UPI0018E45A72